MIGANASDAALRVPTISFVVEGRDSEEVVREIDRLRIGIRFGDFYSKRLIEDLGIAGSTGVVRDRLITRLDRAI